MSDSFKAAKRESGPVCPLVGYAAPHTEERLGLLAPRRSQKRNNAQVKVQRSQWASCPLFPPKIRAEQGGDGEDEGQHQLPILNFKYSDAKRK